MVNTLYYLFISFFRNSDGDCVKLHECGISSKNTNNRSNINEFENYDKQSTKYGLPIDNPYMSQKDLNSFPFSREEYNGWQHQFSEYRF